MELSLRLRIYELHQLPSPGLVVSRDHGTEGPTAKQSGHGAPRGGVELRACARLPRLAEFVATASMHANVEVA
eukprot:scaffold73071_cov105-Phaeocystis_antarctica.AAC.2